MIKNLIAFISILMIVLNANFVSAAVKGPVSLQMNEKLGTLYINFQFPESCDYKYAIYDSENDSTIKEGKDYYEVGTTSKMEVLSCKNLEEDILVHYTLKIYVEKSNSEVEEITKYIEIFPYHVIGSTIPMHFKVDLNDNLPEPYYSDRAISTETQTWEINEYFNITFHVSGHCDCEFRLYDAKTNKLIQSDNKRYCKYNRHYSDETWQYISGVSNHFEPERMINGDVRHYLMKAKFKFFNYEPTSIGFKLLNRNGEIKEIVRDITIRKIKDKYYHILSPTKYY